MALDPSAFSRQIIAPLLAPWKDHERTTYCFPQRLAELIFPAASRARVLRFVPSVLTSIRSDPLVRSSSLSPDQLNAKASGIPESTGVGELSFDPVPGITSTVCVVFTCTVPATLPSAESVSVL